MGRRSRFDGEFRAQAVELARRSSRPRYQIAAELGVSDTTLAKWMTKSCDSSNGDDDGLSVSERAELEALRKERAEWVLEREILKKFVAWWVKENRG
jgi:transposase